jgi:small-conductance mechanosensitive channel
MVNWTLGNSTRRFELLLNVAFGTDLEKTEKLLLGLMENDPRILKNPHPFVLVNRFKTRTLDLSMKFWVSHFDIGLDVKSDLIRAIEVLFREQGIGIPFPRQNVSVV